jgi:hypothetical protein
VDDWPVELAMVSTGKLLGVALGYCHFMPFVCSQGRTLSHQQWRVFICLSGCFQHNKTVFFMGGKIGKRKTRISAISDSPIFFGQKIILFYGEKIASLTVSGRF